MYRIFNHSAGLILISLSTCMISACQPELETADDWHQQGIVHIQKGNLTEAIEHLNQAVQLDPQNGTMLVNRGLVRDERGEHTIAIEDYTQAIALGENLREAYYNRGNAYYNLEQFDNAVADYSEAIKLEENFPYAYVNRAINLEALGELERAIEDFKTALDIFRSNKDTANAKRIDAKLREITAKANES